LAEAPPIRRIVDAWHAALGGRVPIDGRLQALRDLLYTIKTHGYKDEDVTDPIARLISEKCAPPRDVYKGDKAKWARWVATSARDLELARMEVFGALKIERAGEEQLHRASYTPETVRVERPAAPEPEFVRAGKELDRNIFRGEPKPTMEIDKEFCKDLGIEVGE